MVFSRRASAIGSGTVPVIAAELAVGSFVMILFKWVGQGEAVRRSLLVPCAPTERNLRIVRSR